MKLYPGLEWRIFHILTSENIDDFICLLNGSLIHWCMIETSSGLPGKSSAIFGTLRASSVIFGQFCKMFGNVRVTFGQVLENLRKSSDSGRCYVGMRISGCHHSFVRY